jgi:hypothetical protein
MNELKLSLDTSRTNHISLENFIIPNLKILMMIMMVFIYQNLNMAISIQRLGISPQTIHQKVL